MYFSMYITVLPVRDLECRMTELGDKAVCASACTWRVVTNRREILVHVICNKDQKSQGKKKNSQRLDFRVIIHIHNLFCAYIKPMVCLLTLLLKLQAKGSNLFRTAGLIHV